MKGFSNVNWVFVLVALAAAWVNAQLSYAVGWRAGYEAAKRETRK